MDPKDLFTKKLQHYDFTYEYNINHDTIPYKRNSDICNAGTIAINSGNVLKSPVYKFDQEQPFVYKAPDMVFEVEENDTSNAENEVTEVMADDLMAASDESVLSSAPSAAGISSDQLDSLLADNGSAFDNKVWFESVK